MQLRAAIYARVSSAGQRDRHTIDGQLKACTEYAARQGWRVTGTYLDDGKTGKAGQLAARGGFAKLAKDAAAGAFDVVIIFDLDRLSRSEDITERGAILGAFQRAGVKLAIATTGQVLDLSSSMGDMFAGLQSFFAADWLRKHRERIKQAKVRAIARGKKPSGPTPFGWIYERSTGTWSLHPVNAELLREMHRRIADGESCAQIADDFDARRVPRPRGGSWTRERVWQIVIARTALGEWTADKARRLVIKVPPIVDEATWDRTQARLMRDAKRGLRRTKYVYLLEEIAACSICGARVGICSALRVSRRRKTAIAARYVCGHRRFPPRASERCPLPYRFTADVDDRLWAALVELVGRKDLLADATAKDAETGDDRATWQRDLDGWTRRIARLTQAETQHLARHRRGLISATALETELRASARERKELERQVEAARRALVAADRVGERTSSLRQAVEEARTQLATISQEGRRHVVRALLEPGSVVLGPTKVRAIVRLAALSPDESLVGEGTSRTTLRIRLVA